MKSRVFSDSENTDFLVNLLIASAGGDCLIAGISNRFQQVSIRKARIKQLYKGGKKRKVKTSWKIGIVLAILGIVALIGAACSSSAAQTPAPTVTVTQTATVTATPQAAKGLILSSDMVTGSGGTVKAAASCVLQSAYKQGNQVVFRVRVYDPKTGNPMDNTAVSAVTIKLPDGQTFNAKYGKHGTADSFWATSWVIPVDYPTGTINYTATATATDGRTGNFDNFNVAPSLLTVVQ